MVYVQICPFLRVPMMCSREEFGQGVYVFDVPKGDM